MRILFALCIILSTGCATTTVISKDSCVKIIHVEGAVFQNTSALLYEEVQRQSCAWIDNPIYDVGVAEISCWCRVPTPGELLYK